MSLFRRTYQGQEQPEVYIRNHYLKTAQCSLSLAGCFLGGVFVCLFVCLFPSFFLLFCFGCGGGGGGGGGGFFYLIVVVSFFYSFLLGGFVFVFWVCFSWVVVLLDCCWVVFF